jgi:putrescine---pyruvate transaminase
VIGAGGVRPPEPGYIAGVAEVCAERGILFVCDSVICGFGRLGSWYGIERFEVVPDMIIFAKGVTSGYLPLGGVVVSERVAEPFWGEPGGPVFRHGATYAGHATCCAAALANLDLLEDGLLERGRLMEGPLAAALEAAGGHAAVREVRAGLGFLGAIELEPDLLAADPGTVVRVAQAVRRNGVMVRPLATSIAVSPPLTATEQHLELLTEALVAGLDEAIAKTPAGTRAA